MPKASFNKFCCGKSACLSILTASLLKHLQTLQDTDDIKIFLKLKFMEKLLVLDLQTIFFSQLVVSEMREITLDVAF